MRDALAYYTDMQKALEEEKSKKDSMVESSDGDKNGLLHTSKAGPSTGGFSSSSNSSGEDKLSGHSLLLSKASSLSLRRGSTTRLTSKHSLELDTSSSS